MKRRLTAIAAAAIVFAAMSTSCGKVDDESSSVTVKVGNTTEASEGGSESTSGSTEASSEAKTTGKKTTEASTEASSEEKTEASSKEKTEEKTEAPTEKATQAPTETPTEAPTEAPTSAQVSASPVNGAGYLGSDISVLTGTYGTGYTTYVIQSCLPIGDDDNNYIYEYSGMKAMCYSEGGSHRVATLSITGSNYSTPEGITVGSSKSAVEAAYGSGSVQGNGDIDYNYGTYSLYFTMSGDSVAQIDYVLNY